MQYIKLNYLKPCYKHSHTGMYLIHYHLLFINLYECIYWFNCPKTIIKCMKLRDLQINGGLNNNFLIGSLYVVTTYSYSVLKNIKNS